jgi:peroxiredoxin
MKKSTIFLLLSLSLITYPSLSAQDTLESVTIKGFTLPYTDNSGLLSIDSLKDQKAIALVFCNTYCSFCKNYIDRLNAMARAYDSLQVSFLVIDSNHPGLSNKDEITTNSFEFPYLRDSTQEIARMLEVTINPEALILVPEDSVFRLVYRGKIDNIPLNLPGVQSHIKPFLANALEDVLKAKSPLVSKTELGGCRIKWIDKESSANEE